MVKDSNWEALVSNLVKSELKKQGLSYADLVERLQQIGVIEREANIANKLARGRFTAVFLAQVLTAIGSTRLDLN